MSTALAPVKLAASTPGIRIYFPASAREIMLNYVSAAALLVLGFAFYSLLFHTLSYYHDATFTPLGFLAIQVVLTAYLLFLPIFYATFPDDYPVKCRLFWRALANLRRRRPTEKEATALRAVAVKAFFMPLMIAWLALSGFSLDSPLWTGTTAGFYETVLGLIVIVDLSCFTVAYGVEHPWLKNEIRSVEPTILGWVSALACYPPFHLVTMFILLRGPGELAEERLPYEGPAAQIIMGGLMLGLMGIYASASVALGLKASNLTNRGTVSRGPYAVIRHPAYLCKNLFWWMVSLPMIAQQWQAEEWQGLAVVVLSLLAWNAIYTVRALTEERHLMVDPDYRDYCGRVKWRFIPGVW
ncbi:MAG TPA: DUF1295 domain-containing protein [Urbifossiella sp.]